VIVGVVVGGWKLYCPLSGSRKSWNTPLGGRRLAHLCELRFHRSRCSGVDRVHPIIRWSGKPRSIAGKHHHYCQAQ